MPDPAGLKSELALPMDDSPLIPPQPLLYSVEERAQLREMLGSPLFRKALANARLSRPHIFPSGSDSALGAVVCNNRLHQLQGWTMFETALARETLVPGQRRVQAQDTYPDAGRPDYQPPAPPVVTPPPNVPMPAPNPKKARRR